MCVCVCVWVPFYGWRWAKRRRWVVWWRKLEGRCSRRWLKQLCHWCNTRLETTAERIHVLVRSVLSPFTNNFSHALGLFHLNSSHDTWEITQNLSVKPTADVCVDVPANRPLATACDGKVWGSSAAQFQPQCRLTCWDRSLTPARRWNKMLRLSKARTCSYQEPCLFTLRFFTFWCVRTSESKPNEHKHSNNFLFGSEHFPLKSC